MPSKSELLQKLRRGKLTKRELDTLMGKCNCRKASGGRGSGIAYIHSTGRVVMFDEPHPQKELYRYQVKKVLQFLEDVAEMEE